MNSYPTDPSILAMTAMQRLAIYISEHATHALDDADRFTPAFLDDDSDYMPAALDMMTELMRALTDDDSTLACADLYDRIRRDDFMLTNSTLRFSDLPLDINIDPEYLPIIDML